MKKVDLSREVAPEIFRFLGIEIEGCVSAKIQLKVGRPVVVKARYITGRICGEALETTTKKFKVVQID